MPIHPALTDAAILEDFGRRLAARRVDLGLTQSALATKADVGKRTIERIEAGRSIQLSNLIAILRQLELLNGLDRLLPEAGPRPMDLLHRRSNTRQRVGSRRRAENRSPDSRAWTWNDEDDEG